MRWTTKKVKLSELRNWEKNPRTISKENFGELVSSVDDLGNFEPLVVDTDMTVIAGNQRLRALQELGVKEVEVSIPERKLTDEEIKKVGLLSNRHAGEWDIDMLANEFEEVLEDLDMSELLPEPVVEVEEDDYEVGEDIEVHVKEGDVWQLGEHRLMCGDSTVPSDMSTLMGKELALLVIADPPYGMHKDIENDNLNLKDLLEFNEGWSALTFEHIADNGSWYCFGMDEPLMDIYAYIIKPMIEEQKATFRNLITWDKGYGQGQLSPNFRMYAVADEKILFVMMGVQGFNNNTDNYYEGWEPIRQYLLNERKKCGWNVPTMKAIAGHSGKSRDHWTSKSQWNLPTEEVYEKFQKWAKEHDIDAFRQGYDEIKKEYDEIKKEWYKTRAYFDNTHDNMNNVWHFERTGESERVSAGGHDTPKPVALITRIVQTSSPEGGLVLDPFGGSGSTLLACEQTNRVCYTMEVDPYYCQVIINRWEQFTGKRAVRLDN